MSATPSQRIDALFAHARAYQATILDLTIAVSVLTAALRADGTGHVVEGAHAETCDVCRAVRRVIEIVAAAETVPTIATEAAC